MKLRSIQIIAFILALFTVNIGFARAELLLCQTKCNYLQQNGTDVPPCCRSAKNQDHALFQSGGHDFPGTDCPHLKSSKKISDSLSFLAGSAKLPAPDKNPTLAGSAAISIDRFPGPEILTYLPHTGLSPPDIVGPPPYRLYCSLLI